MSLDIIQERLKAYDCQSKNEELHAMKEIAQEIALAGLARTDFFKHTAFQGGTCLRICHQLQRFSEDLDFTLMKGGSFSWSHYLQQLPTEFSAYGLHLDIRDRSEAKGHIKSAFLKENSFGRVLSFKYPRTVSDSQMIRIKLEIDTNPPLGSEFESRIIPFPFSYSVVTQDLPSLFGGKCHALLCRPYIKGRDWYDFLWFVSHGVSVNIELLKNAVKQIGPWEGKEVAIDISWLKNELKTRVEIIEWEKVRQEVLQFLKQREAEQLKFWSTDFFLQFVNKMTE
ncbi:MAG: nucleotidyl transferase AbiEii/AbiGii toxin family protein [Rhabdochlamydiaceae bacterium]